MNTDTVVVGLVLIVLGVVFGLIICLGVVLVVIGLIVMLVGLLQQDEPKTVIHYYPPQSQPGVYAVGQPGSVNFCPYCGMHVPPGAMSCMRCGRPIPGTGDK